MAILKYYAISRVEIQNNASYVIFVIATYFILAYKDKIKGKLPTICMLYLLSLFISSIHITLELSYNDFLNSLLFPLLFLTSYIFFKKYPEYIVVMKYLGIILLVLSYFNLLRLSAMANERTTITIQSNAGNAVVALLPFAFMWKNKIVKYAFIIVTFVACLIAIKRSAFVIFVVVVFVYLLLKRRTNILKPLIIYSVIIITFGTYILPRIEMAERMIERLEGTAEDGGSGRNKLAVRCLEYQSESTLPEWVLGNGYLSFSKESAKHGKFNTGAHNDIVEILYNHGIISYIIYVALLWYMVRYIIKMREEENTNLLPFTSCVIVFFLSAILVGPSIHYWYYLPMYCLFGGLNSNNKTYK